MQIDSFDELNEVVTVVGHKNKATLADFCEDRMVGCARQTEMCDVIGLETKLMRYRRQLGAETLINQKWIAHCATRVCQGRFLGRPARG